VNRRTYTIAIAALALAACSRNASDRFVGYAEADLVYVSSAVGGILQTLAVDRGARVERGALLFRLEPDPEAHDRAAAAARAESAAAQARNLKKGKRPDELRAVEQQLAQAQAALQLSRQELARNEQLVKQGFVAATRLDELRSGRDRDVARVAELQAQLAVARDAARPDEIASADASQRAAESELAGSQWRELQTARLAPVAAAVFDTLYRVGEWVPPGSPVVSLLPENALKLRFYVPERELARIRVGSRVEVGCDGCPPAMTAIVNFISPQAEFTPPVIYSNESRSKLVFLVEARPEGAAATALKPGQPIDVRLAAEAAR
jgi:HlyD family secretion protein